MSCAFSRLILESIRVWVASSHSLRVMAQLELRWLEADAVLAWPALEQFLAIIYWEREREIEIAIQRESPVMTADEAALVVALILARWDVGAAAHCLGAFLNEDSARAAANAAARLRGALAASPPAVSWQPSLFSYRTARVG